MPYRSAAISVTPRTLDELFAAASDLRTGDELELRYEVLPWKRIVVTIRHRPASLAAFVTQAAGRLPVSVTVSVGSDLPPGRYEVRPRDFGTLELWPPELGGYEGVIPTYGLETLESVERGKLVLGPARIGLARGTLELRITGYQPSELAGRFADSFPWETLGLPRLLNREWQRARP